MSGIQLNTIYNEDCLETMKRMPDGFVDFIVSSPPYFNLRDYANWDSYESHLESVENWFVEMFRVLKQGRHVAWNIQDNTPEPTKNGRQMFKDRKKLKYTDESYQKCKQFADEVRKLATEYFGEQDNQS